MADVEDDAEFGSHFLDSMLEVEMTEEDGELDMSKNEDPLGASPRAFPPIPMFDLQSETLSYKDVYRNSVVQAPLPNLPLATSTEKVPMTVPVIKSGPMFAMYPKNLIPSNNSLTTPAPIAVKPNSLTIQKTSIKYNTKPTTPFKASAALKPLTPYKSTNFKSLTTFKPPTPYKSLTAYRPPTLNKPTASSTAPAVATTTNTTTTSSALIKNVEISEQIAAGHFLQQVFKPEYVKNVFVKKGPDSELNVVGKEEMDYYKVCFKDISKVQYCRLHCTICDKHLGCGDNVAKKLTVHNMLKVLTCKTCNEFYGDGNFPCDKKDNCEIYCRWCGQGGALVCCSFCPRVFCKKCVRRNFGPAFLRSIQKASEWACFCCAQKPLWPHRAICRALMDYMAQRKPGKTPHKDTTRCCGGSILGRKRNIDKNKIIDLQRQFKINPAAKTSFGNVKDSLFPPVKAFSGREQSILKNNMQVVNDQNKNSVSSLKLLNKNSKANAPPNIFSRSAISGNNILRSINTSTPNKMYSNIPSPQLIQSPVLHGETLITPPGSRKLIPKSQFNMAASSNTSSVKVSLTNQTPNLDMRGIPMIKIPHDVQGLLLRMSFPDNKVQFVRLIPDGSGCKTSKDFPMPALKQKPDFIEENLADSFKVSKMIYDKLMFVRGKVNSRTKSTEENVFASSVKKLHFIYEKAGELFKELDKNLLENHDEWKNESKAPVDVIDLSDEDGISDRIKKRTNRRTRFLDKCKELVLSDDSDIEILDDSIEAKSNSLNSNTSQNISINGNLKEKHKLKSSKGADHNAYLYEKNTPVKRKRGWQKGRKRLKVIDNDKKQEQEIEISEEREIEKVEDPLYLKETYFDTEVIEKTENSDANLEEDLKEETERDNFNAKEKSEAIGFVPEKEMEMVNSHTEGVMEVTDFNAEEGMGSSDSNAEEGMDMTDCNTEGMDRDDHNAEEKMEMVDCNAEEKMEMVECNAEERFSNGNESPMLNFGGNSKNINEDSEISKSISQDRDMSQYAEEDSLNDERFLRP